MGGVEKWSQHDIDIVFWLRYGLEFSESVIANFMAQNVENHQNAKVPGIRYVLRCKQPSAGIPNDPKKMQAQLANVQVEQQNSKVPTWISEIEQGLLTQLRLQQQFANREKELLNSPQFVSIQQEDSLHYQTAIQSQSNQHHTLRQESQIPEEENHHSSMKFGAFQNQVPIANPQEISNNYSTPFMSQISQEIMQETSVALDTDNDSSSGFISHFGLSNGQQQQDIINQKEDLKFPALIQSNDESSTQYITSEILPDSSQDCAAIFNIFKPCQSDFTQLKSDDVNPNFVSSIEQPQDGDVPGLLSHSQSQGSHDKLLRTDYQGDMINFTSSASVSSTQTNDSLNESRQSKFNLPAIPRFCTERSKSFQACIKKNKSHKFRRPQSSPRKGNRFGGVKGSPADGLPLANSNFDSFVNPICDAGLFEDYCSNLHSELPMSDLQQNNSDMDQHIDKCVISGLANSAMPTRQTETQYLDTDKVTVPSMSTINLYNPEFYQPFCMPLDPHFWTVGKSKQNDLTLHSNTPKGQVTINMISPRFHSGFCVNEAFVPSIYSQELLNVLEETGVVNGVSESERVIHLESGRNFYLNTSTQRLVDENLRNSQLVSN